MSLSQFDAVSLGTTQDTIIQVFGQPDETADLAPKEQSINLIYKVGEYSHVFFVIGKGSKLLEAKAWDVMDGAPEQNIETALARYPQAHFKRRDAKIINPHYGPNEAWYEDRAIGLSIEINKARNEVSSISWFAPGTPPPRDPVCIKYRMKNGLISCRPQE